MKATVRARYEVLNHGAEHSDFFQGVGVSHTGFASAVTGVGSNAAEAYADCVDQIFMLYGSKAEALRLPRHPRGIRASDRLNAAQLACDEYHYYVSVRFTVNV